jgi:hypothetical protein
MTTKPIQNEQTSYLRCVLLRIVEIHYRVLKVLDNYGTDDSRLFVCLLSSLLMAALNLGDASEPKSMQGHINANYFNSFFDSLCFFGTKKLNDMLKDWILQDELLQVVIVVRFCRFPG